MKTEDRSWEKRLTGKPNALMIDFVESLSVDQRLAKYDIQGSIAHASMLAQQKIITKSEFNTIKDGLNRINKQIDQGKFIFDKSREDIHMAIESALIADTHGAGEKLHTGRSRNDQVATDMRLWMRDQVSILQDKITQLQKSFVTTAALYTDDFMSAYTHFQRAQPIVIGAYLLSFVDSLERDKIRLGNCSDLLNISPLGSGAIAGSTLNIDRKQTALDLGFARISRNSIDSVSDRDFCAEFIFVCSLISVHLSRLAEDWIIYSSSEFGFINISDSLCTSSSMMPQKRNPDVLELVRGKTGSVYGALMAMLTILKAQPTGYNRDLQEDKTHVFAASDTIEACLDIVNAVVLNTRFNTEHISKNLDTGFLDATALAEYLVQKSVPFRKAHGIVGAVVSACEKKNIRLTDMSLEEFKQYSDAISEDVYKFLGPQKVAQSYVTAGAGGPKQTIKQIKFWEKHLEIIP